MILPAIKSEMSGNEPSENKRHVKKQEAGQQWPGLIAGVYLATI